MAEESKPALNRGRTHILTKKKKKNHQTAEEIRFHAPLYGCPVYIQFYQGR